MMTPQDLYNELHFVYSEKLRSSFASGELPREWLKRYPMLFTEKDDLRLTGIGSKYLFFEWLAPVLLYEATGYLSYHKYDCKVHAEKHAIFRRFCSPELFGSIVGQSGTPDLLVVSPDKASDFFFCEVKGDRDKIGPKQERIADMILKSTGRKVMLMNLRRV